MGSERPLVVYHKNCRDGQVAAWVAKRALGECDLLPAQYGEEPPTVDGREVYIVDFSYPRDALLDMHGRAASLLVLDHHKTAQADLEGLDFCTFDMEESGASLAWKHWHPGTLSPRLVRYVKDRDLWRFKLLQSREINAWIRSFDFEMDICDSMAKTLEDDDGFTSAVEQGGAILRVQQIMVEAHTQHAIPVTLGDLEFDAVNCTAWGIVSEVAGQLATRTGAGACWWASKDGSFTWSARGDGSVDVSAVAKQHGGGGHRSAAGFSVDHETMAAIMGWEAR